VTTSPTSMVLSYPARPQSELTESVRNASRNAQGFAPARPRPFEAVEDAEQVHDGARAVPAGRRPPTSELRRQPRRRELERLHVACLGAGAEVAGLHRPLLASLPVVVAQV
jgi:hypothetical protein